MLRWEPYGKGGLNLSPQPRGNDPKNRLVQMRSYPGVDNVRGLWVRAAALSLVSADTRTVICACRKALVSLHWTWVNTLFKLDQWRLGFESLQRRWGPRKIARNQESGTARARFRCICTRGMAIILYKKIKKKVIRVEMRSRSVRCEERGQMEGTCVLRRPCGRKRGTCVLKRSCRM